MSNLREYAQGQPCMIRLPGCRFNGETTVLCHHRGVDTGMSQKEPDVIGAWGCEHCHAVIDGREAIPKGWTRDQIKEAFTDGIFRTQKQLVKDGILTW